MAYIVMAYIVMAYIVMAYIVMALYSYGSSGQNISHRCCILCNTCLPREFIEWQLSSFQKRPTDVG